MQARGFAALREPGECTQLLIQHETALAISHAEEPSQRFIALRPSDRTRNRAFGQFILVTVLISQDKPDEACAVAAQVLDATQSLGSYLVIQQLLDLKQLLEAHRANKWWLTSSCACDRR